MHIGTFQNIKPTGLQLKCQENGKEQICGTLEKLWKTNLLDNPHDDANLKSLWNYSLLTGSLSTSQMQRQHWWNDNRRKLWEKSLSKCHCPPSIIHRPPSAWTWALSMKNRNCEGYSMAYEQTRGRMKME
jgi:hypothetical protein